MSEYLAHPAEPAGMTPGGGVPVRPDAWLPASGVTPFSAAPPAPVALSLSYTATPGDVVAAVLEHEATRKYYEQGIRKEGWRRSLRTLPITLGLVLAANLFMFDLGVGWSVLSTVILAGLFAVVQWSQIDHIIKRRLPGMLQKVALSELAQRGDQRRIVAEPAGLTLADAASTQSFTWQQVQLTQSDQYVIIAAGNLRWAVPTVQGRALADIVRLARSHGAG